MAKYLGPKCKIIRREQYDLSLFSGLKEIKNKCKIKKMPGQHSDRRSRNSDYNLQLREKQKVKRIYGILEKQFKKYYNRSVRLRGNTGENLLKILESRLDNVVYRIGFGVTRAESRQIISHKLIKLNNKIVNISSYLVKINDTIELVEKAKLQDRILYSLKLSEEKEIIPWINFDKDKMLGKFIRYPNRSELPSDINEHLIIELYSK
ncbi:MAG: 30S ribosomal protein S4 [Enterobacteriaceae bacterium]